MGGSMPVDKGEDDDSGDQGENQQMEERGKPDSRYTNGYSGEGRGRGRARGFRGYRPRYVRRGGFRPPKEVGNTREDMGGEEGAPFRGRGRGRGLEAASEEAFL